MITSYLTTRIADVTVVRVTSDLAGTVYYHWYAEGEYLGRTTDPERAFQLAENEQLRVEVLDTTDADYDTVANAPAGYPARRTLAWLRSIDADAAWYRVDQQQDSGDWTEIARVPAEAGRWEYRLETDRLEDLATYTWRIVPLDTAGNEGTAVTIGPERVVRRPDAPAVALSCAAGLVTIAEDA